MQIRSAIPQPTSQATTYENTPASPAQTNDSSQGKPGPGPADDGGAAPDSTGGEAHLAKLADALEQLPEAERAELIQHVDALIRMSPRRRAAILTLTNAEG